MELEKVVIASIIAPHGVKGLVKVKSYAEPKELILSLDLTMDSGEVALLGKHGKCKDGLICSINNIDDRNIAQLLTGKKLFCLRKQLPQTNDDDEFYISDLVSCKVFENGVEIGVVCSVQNFGAGDIVEIKFAKDSGFFPFNKTCFPEIDLVSKKITFTRPL